FDLSVGGRSGQVLAVGTESKHRDRQLGSADHKGLTQGFSRLRVPNSYGAVLAGGEMPSIPTECHTMDIPSFAKEGLGFLMQGRVPHLDGPIPAGGDEAATLGSKRHFPDGSGVSAKPKQFPIGLHVPELDAPLRSARSQALPVGAEANAPNGSGVAQKDVTAFACRGVPDLDRLIPTPRGQVAAIRAKRQGAHVFRMSGDFEECLE